MWIGIVSVWLLCGLVAGMIGATKGVGSMAFLVGFLFGPFGIIIALIDHGDRVECPFCRERINPRAVVCPRCQRDQPAMSNPSTEAKDSLAPTPWSRIIWVFWIGVGLFALLVFFNRGHA